MNVAHRPTNTSQPAIGAGVGVGVGDQDGGPFVSTRLTKEV
jgi:hypothetical protein